MDALVSDFSQLLDFQEGKQGWVLLRAFGMTVLLLLNYYFYRWAQWRAASPTGGRFRQAIDRLCPRSLGAEFLFLLISAMVFLMVSRKASPHIEGVAAVIFCLALVLWGLLSVIITIWCSSGREALVAGTMAWVKQCVRSQRVVDFTGMDDDDSVDMGRQLFDYLGLAFFVIGIWWLLSEYGSI